MKHQHGSAHVIAIGLLSVALLGTLGVVFYQNFIEKKENPIASSVSKLDAKKETSPVEPKLATYCALIEKLCFKYPADWRIVAHDAVNGQVPIVYDNFDLVSDSGATQLNFESGIGGIGGVCDLADSHPVSTLGTYSTKLSGYTVESPQYQSDTAYAIKTVERDPRSGKWMPRMALSISPKQQQIGDAMSCDLGYANLVHDRNLVSDLTGKREVYGLFRFTSKDTVGYSTKNEAVQSLSASDAVKAYDVLRSVYYQ